MNTYLDLYIVTGLGAFGADEDAVYLTDGKTFSKFIGTYDTGTERIIGRCQGNAVKIEKYIKDEKRDSLVLVESRTYSKSELSKFHD
jgi:hypothetical protein